MRTENPKYRWKVVAILFGFQLLHQMDKLLIGPLKGSISEDFGITNTQYGMVISSALVIATILYPVWGYLYDRYARAKLLALASAIWGLTTTLSALMRTYGAFIVTRASTGVDDSAYPGLTSLVADYFEPETRGKVYGLLGVSSPIGYLLGMGLALMVAPMIGWRNLFLITGGLGFVVAAAIFFGVKELPRGKSEPELAGMEEIKPYRFSWAQAKDLFRKKTMWFVALGGFFGIIPWTVIIYFFFDFLGRERGYSEQSVLLTMAPLVLIMAVGTFLGGWLGDRLFARNRKGRIIVIVVTILLAVVFLWAAMSIPVENKVMFFILMAITAFVMPMAGSNLTSTISDVIVPEVRSSAHAVLNFIGDSGGAFAPIAAGIVADSFNMGVAILWVGGIAWLIAALSYGGLLFFIENDIDHLRSTMKERAALQVQTNQAKGS